MATNLVLLNVYQINQGPAIPLVSVLPIAFPTQGVIVSDCSASPAQLLSTGIRVYASLQIPNTFSSTGTSSLFYTEKTQAAIITLFNA